MSDVLIVGFKPKSELGKEFCLDSTDWWYEILEVFDEFIPVNAELDDFLFKECMFCPRTPYLEENDAIEFACILEKYLFEDSIKSFLLKMYQDEPLYQEYFEGDIEFMEENVQERTDQISSFICFLKACGGCRAKWDGMDD